MAVAEKEVIDRAICADFTADPNSIDMDQANRGGCIRCQAMNDDHEGRLVCPACHLCFKYHHMLKVNGILM